MPINETGPDIFAAGWCAKKHMTEAQSYLEQAEDENKPADQRRGALDKACDLLINAKDNLAWCYLEAGLNEVDCATMQIAASAYRSLTRRARQVEIEDE